MKVGHNWICILHTFNYKQYTILEVKNITLTIPKSVFQDERSEYFTF